MDKTQETHAIILGQKYAYATAALLVGISSYIQLLGLERAILAILFAWLALRSRPGPRLRDRRLWAMVGLVLALVMLTIVPLVVIFKFEIFKEFFSILESLQ